MRVATSFGDSLAGRIGLPLHVGVSGGVNPHIFLLRKGLRRPTFSIDEAGNTARRRRQTGADPAER